jgi:ribulose-phosphate 3-epimerase
MIKVSPSILNSDFSNLGAAVKMLDGVGADWIHLDIMDGNFVPEISFGAPVISAVRALTAKPLDAHLMVLNPAATLEKIAAAGADIITVHTESPENIHLKRTLAQIRALGKKAGVALNPATHHNALEYIYDDADLILVMSVNPGFGGQAFLQSSLRKIEAIANRISSLNLAIELEVDGGINLDNAKAVRDAGATVIVAGSAIVSSSDPAKVIRGLCGCS